MTRSITCALALASVVALAGCAVTGAPASSSSAEDALGESSGLPSPAVSPPPGSVFLSVGGSTADAAVYARLASHPIDLRFDVVASGTLGVNGPCHGTTYEVALDDQNIGTLGPAGAQTYSACSRPTDAAYGAWLDEFLPGARFALEDDRLVLVNGEESITFQADPG